MSNNPKYWELPPERWGEGDRLADTISAELARGITQAELAKTLREHDAVADVIACLLDPSGYLGMQLKLTRNIRGPARRWQSAAHLIENRYEEEVAEGRKRGAIKRIAQNFNVSPEAVRSIIRRGITGTHDLRRNERGRK
jgi:hypothetical protein